MTAVDVTRDGAVATVRLNRPDKLNALDRATRWELVDVLREVGAATDVRAVVLTGTGRAFCVGPIMYCEVDEIRHRPLEKYCSETESRVKC